MSRRSAQVSFHFGGPFSEDSKISNIHDIFSNVSILASINSAKVILR